MGCFVPHQAVEKDLKGLNLALGQAGLVPYAHPTLGRPADTGLQPRPPVGLEDRLRLLDDFYIPTRYPGQLPGGRRAGVHLGRLPSDQALLRAGVITHWIRAALAQRSSGASGGGALG